MRRRHLDTQTPRGDALAQEFGRLGLPVSGSIIRLERPKPEVRPTDYQQLPHLDYLNEVVNYRNAVVHGQREISSEHLDRVKRSSPSTSAAAEAAFWQSRDTVTAVACELDQWMSVARKRLSQLDANT